MLPLPVLPLFLPLVDTTMHSAILVSAENAQLSPLASAMVITTTSWYSVAHIFLTFRQSEVVRHVAGKIKPILLLPLVFSILSARSTKSEGSPAFPSPTRQSFCPRAFRIFFSSSLSLSLPLNTALGVLLLGSESGLVNGGFKNDNIKFIMAEFVLCHHCCVVFSADLLNFCSHHWKGRRFFRGIKQGPVHRGRNSRLSVCRRASCGFGCYRFSSQGKCSSEERQ